MTYVITLLVDDDAKIARGVSRALEARGLPRPHHVTTGRDALAWVAHNACGLCFLASKLPDMSGVDLTVQLRQRTPGLPIYMLSGARSESVAVAAFRAGVTDYLPKDSGRFDTVVRVVQQLSAAETNRTALPAAPPIPVAMPRELLNPTYENRLRMIGRQVDLNGYHRISVLEVEGGFLVHALPKQGRQAQALEFPDRDFLHWIMTAYRHRGGGERSTSACPLLPSGYEDFLRAIGAALDRDQAEAITIAEFERMIVVSGIMKLETPTQTTQGNVQWILGENDIQQLLNEGFRRRARQR